MAHKKSRKFPNVPDPLLQEYLDSFEAKDGFDRFVARLCKEKRTDAMDYIREETSDSIAKILNARRIPAQDKEDLTNDIYLLVFGRLDPEKGNFAHFVKAQAKWACIRYWAVRHPKEELEDYPADDPDSLRKIIIDESRQRANENLEMVLELILTAARRPERVLIFMLTVLMGKKPGELLEEFGSSTFGDMTDTLCGELEIHGFGKQVQAAARLRESLEEAAHTELGNSTYGTADAIAKLRFQIRKGLREVLAAARIMRRNPEQLVAALGEAREPPHRVLVYLHHQVLDKGREQIIQMNSRTLRAIYQSFIKEMEDSDGSSSKVQGVKQKAEWLRKQLSQSERASSTVGETTLNHYLEDDDLEEQVKQWLKSSESKVKEVFMRHALRDLLE